MKFFLFFLIVFSSFSSAFSKENNEDGFPINFCAPAAKISPASEYCEDNDVFVRSASLCLTRLKAEIKKEGDIVSKYFSQSSGSKQNEHFSQSSYNHRQASERLARLIRLTKKTALEVDTYFDKVYFPIDYDLPEVNGGDQLKFMMSEPCYGETVKSLDSIMNKIVGISQKLWSAKAVADSFAAQLNKSESKITNTGTQEILRERKPASSKDEKGIDLNKSTVSDSRAKKEK